MNILIPTYGRPQRQETLRQLLKADIHPTLVVQACDEEAYKRAWGETASIKVLPEHITTIAPTRQFILEHLAQDKFCMVDDDLYFYKRRDDDRGKLREIAAWELNDAFREMDRMLDSYAHVGLAAREGANRETNQYVYNTRIMRVLGYHKPTLQRLGIGFDAMEVMEDFHVALRLLEAGNENLVMNEYAHNQSDGSGAEGGCSHFRTPELQARNAELLAKLHPGFVKVMKKMTKGAWGGGVRTDVIVYWKKAYASFSH